MTSRMDRVAGRGVFRRVWLIGLLLVAGVWWSLYWLSGSWWIADVAMSGGVHVGVVLCIGGGVGLVVWRSGWSLMVFFVCVSVGLMCVSGRRVLPARGGGPERTYLEMVTMNLNMGNTHAEELFAMLDGVEGDVVVLVEPRWEVFEAIKGGQDSLLRFPYRAYRLREGKVTTPMMILSRWPLTRDTGMESWAGVSVVVGRGEADGGPFRLVGIHADSPRNGPRWARGNGVIEGVVRVIKGMGDDIPLIIAGDINGGPLGVRDRMLRGGLGVRRASVLFDIRSSYPSNLSMFGLLIDDIWMSGGFRPVSWDTVEVPGSDHHGVRVGLRNTGF